MKSGNKWDESMRRKKNSECEVNKKEEVKKRSMIRDEQLSMTGSSNEQSSMTECGNR